MNVNQPKVDNTVYCLFAIYNVTFTKTQRKGPVYEHHIEQQTNNLLRYIEMTGIKVIIMIA